jgi:hypothetical protein
VFSMLELQPFFYGVNQKHKGIWDVIDNKSIGFMHLSVCVCVCLNVIVFRHIANICDIR